MIMDKESEEYSGFVQNVRDINSSAFSFDLQSQSSSKRFVCFSPEKRKEINDKLLSPVKIKRTRLASSSKGKQDLIFGPTSEIEDTALGFEPINYQEINIDSLHLVADGSLLDIEVAVLDKIGSKLVNEKHIDTYVIGDESNSCKFTVWNHCGGTIEVGASYKLTNARVIKDIYGSFGLSTPMKGFNIEKIAKDIKSPAAFKSFVPVQKTKSGEISFIESIMRYKICSNPKCKKKLPATDKKCIDCLHCNGSIKVKFCEEGVFVKFVLVDSDGEKTSLTMFQDAVKKLIPDFMKLSDASLKGKLLNDFDDIKVTLSNKGDTVNEVEVLKTE